MVHIDLTLPTVNRERLPFVESSAGFMLILHNDISLPYISVEAAECIYNISIPRIALLHVNLLPSLLYPSIDAITGTPRTVRGGLSQTAPL